MRHGASGAAASAICAIGRPRCSAICWASPSMSKRLPTGSSVASVPSRPADRGRPTFTTTRAPLERQLHDRPRRRAPLVRHRADLRTGHLVEPARSVRNAERCAPSVRAKRYRAPGKGRSAVVTFAAKTEVSSVDIGWSSVISSALRAVSRAFSSGSHGRHFRADLTGPRGRTAIAPTCASRQPTATPRPLFVGRQQADCGLVLGSTGAAACPCQSMAACDRVADALRRRARRWRSQDRPARRLGACVAVCGCACSSFCDDAARDSVAGVAGP